MIISKKKYDALASELTDCREDYRDLSEMYQDRNDDIEVLKKHIRRNSHIVAAHRNAIHGLHGALKLLEFVDCEPLNSRARNLLRNHIIDLQNLIEVRDFDSDEEDTTVANDADGIKNADFYADITPTGDEDLTVEYKDFPESDME
jgi:hypothetical protein